MAATTIRRVGVLSVGKVMGLVYAFLGLIGGAMVALFSTLGGAFGAAMSEETGSAMFGAMFGVGAIIIFPLLYGCFGFIGGLIGGAVYNLVSGFVGGIELELSAPVPGTLPVGSPGYGTA
jgi:hypothetical protein